MSSSTTTERRQNGSAKKDVSLTSVLNSGVRKYGKAIISNLSMALRVTRLYSFQHQNVTEATQELVEYLQGFIKLEGGAQLLRVGDFLFLNEVRIRIDFGGQESFQYILDLLTEWDVGEITFSGNLTTREIEQLVALFINHRPDPDDPWKSFEQHLKSHQFDCVTFRQHVERPDLRAELDEDTRVLAIRTFFKSIGIVGDVFDSIRSNRKINLRRMKLAVHALVDLTMNEERVLLALANTKDFGLAGANHAVNTAVIAIALGAKLGLSKKLLGDLGIAALLHDVGKIVLPDELQTTCRERWNVEQQKLYKTHASSGVELLLNQRVINSIVKSINVTFLHHYRYDGTGFPKLMLTKTQNLFTRIIAVANAYDNMTTSNRLEEKAQDPGKVLRTLMDLKGTEYDPLVVKAFVNLMGLYPVGCVVRLDTGEVATVIEPPSDPEHLDRPVVKLISDGGGVAGEGNMSLLERDASGDFRRSILKIYQQDEVHLELDEYLAVI